MMKIGPSSYLLFGDFWNSILSIRISVTIQELLGMDFIKVWMFSSFASAWEATGDSNSVT